MNLEKYFLSVSIVIILSLSGVFGIAHGQEGSLSDEYILIKAVKDRDYNKIRTQLQKGANVNTRGYDDGETPLYIAATMKDKTSAVFLLREKANTDLTTKSNGETPLMASSRLGDKEFVDLLISQKADLNISDRRGETALYKAVQAKRRSVVKALLEANADWSIADHTGRTPLDLAREDTRLRSMIRVLESAGAEY